MSTQKKHRKKRKWKYNVKNIVITSVVFVAIIALVVFACVKCSHKGNTQIETIPETIDVDAVIQNGESLEINLSDCTMYTGSVLQLTCTSTPDSYAANVIWSSSDSSIVSVTKDGTMTVLSQGSAAITATYGVLSDSVAITAIEEGGSYEVNEEEPVYKVVDGETIAVTLSDSSEDKPDSGDGDDKETTSQANPDKETSSNPGNNEGDKETTQEPDKTDNDKSNQIASIITEYGFSSYVEGTYIFNEDGNYLGEAIIESSLLQIYVMTRTTNFDSKIKALLAQILPTGYESVYASFVSATTDQTLNSDGYKVRIVAAANGGHSQIIIYY